MMKKFMPTIVLVCICAVAAALLAGINMITGPIIEAQQNAAANEALLEVLPEGKNFEEIEITADYPACVTKGYKADGGFVFQMTVNGKSPDLMIMCGISNDGKVVGTKVISHAETPDFAARVFPLLEGLDGKYAGMSLNDFEPFLVAGASYTTEAYGEAINAALQAAALTAGVKIDPAIVLESMISELAPGFVDPKEVTAPAGSSFKKILKASNDAGFIYIYSNGEVGYLLLVNATGAAIAYDENGADVTASQTALVDEAKAHAAANQKSYTDALTSKVTNKFFPAASDITAMQVDTFTSIVAAFSFKVENTDYYAYYARTKGYKQMDVFIVLDADGKIAKIDIKQLFFDEEYFDDCPEIDANEYKQGFEGLDDSWNGDEAMIASATKSSNAIKEATNDIFAAFKLLNKGGN